MAVNIFLKKEARAVGEDHGSGLAEGIFLPSIVGELRVASHARRRLGGAEEPSDDGGNDEYRDGNSGEFPVRARSW